MRSFAVTLLVISSLLTMASSQVEPKPLSNKDVIEMVSLGLSDDVIIEKIRSVKTTTFDTSVEGLKSLRAAKVSDAVLKAMINPYGSPMGTDLGKTSDQDNGVAEYRIGYMYGNGVGVVQDYQQALVWYRKAADRGSAAAENDLGRMYKDGLGVAQDDGQAIVWFRKAADQGNGVAEDNLGYMYANGLGVAQDYQQALLWYRKAVDQHDSSAEDNLGYMYEHGLGVVAQDYLQAVTWYRKAAEQGNVQAENQLGMLYKDGNGVPRDDQQSIVWFRKAADQGYATAELNLGWMFANGRGVAQDYQQALSLYRKAADQGSEDVQRYLDALPSAVRERAGQPVSTSTTNSGAMVGSSTHANLGKTADQGQQDSSSADTQKERIGTRDVQSSSANAARQAPDIAEIVNIVQTSLATGFPKMQVRALGDVIVFADPKAFETQEVRTGLHQLLQNSGVEAQLCRFGIKKLRLESPEVTSGAIGEDDLRCPRTEEAAKAKTEVPIAEFPQQRGPKAQTGDITGRIFLITKGGDLKPARLAQVILFYGSDSGTAAVVYLNTKLEKMKESYKLLATPGDASCRAELLVLNSSLKATLEWAQVNRKQDQARILSSDEEGLFHFAGVQPGSYMLVAWGHAGANDACWEENFEVKADQRVEVKLASPHTACLD